MKNIFSLKKEKKLEKSGKIDKNMISRPTDFQHTSHVGFHAKTGFSAENISQVCVL
jgi:hypothetical protein